jgi:hypothetical protein
MLHNEEIETWYVDAIQEAFDDVDDIARFIATSTKEKFRGEKFSSTTMAVLNSLKTWPRSHRRYSDEYDETIRRIEIPGYNAALIYKVYDNTLEVIAVMAFHTLKNPEEYNKIVTERVAIADKQLATK